MRDPFLDDLLTYRLPVHLVLDGARVVNLGGADIAERLAMHGLVGRPLFRETRDRPTVLAGPWLVSLGADHTALQHGIAVAREIGKGVFWLGEPDSEVLFRHLRKLGAATMPGGRILYFRHYDSGVLAAIVPLVDEEQAAYLFGPTQVIAFIGGCGDGRTVVKPDGLPEPMLGPIAFYEWQLAELNERQRKIFRQSVAIDLRAAFPGLVNQEDGELLFAIQEHEKEAHSLGIWSEDALAKWSYLCVYTNGAARGNAKVRERIHRFGSDRSDETFREAFIELIDDYKFVDAAKRRKSA